MKLESFKTLKEEDVAEEYRPLIKTIGFSLNSFAQQVLNALNRNLTVDDNLDQETKTFNIEVRSTGIPKTTTNFGLSKLSRVLKGITVVKATNLTDSTTLSGAPFLTVTQVGKLVEIKHVTGLVADKKYELTVLMF